MGTKEEAGKLARDGGDSFEKQIGASFVCYAQAKKALLYFMPVPTRAVWMPQLQRLIRVADGAAPYDVYGHAPRRLQEPRTANTFDLPVSVGAELKYTKDHHPSIAIVHPDAKSGDGVQYHQLEALALLAQMGGVARIVWNNGGEVGVLTEAGILAAFTIYCASLESERRGKGKGAVGSRSIRWTSFKPVPWANVGGVLCLDWLRIDWQDEGERRAA